jgi:hypothetical protein
MVAEVEDRFQELKNCLQEMHQLVERTNIWCYWISYKDDNSILKVASVLQTQKHMILADSDDKEQDLVILGLQ